MGSVFIAGGKLAMDVPVSGTPAGELAVGSSIWLNENGTLAEYLVVNQGIPSGSSLYDESCNGVWLLRKDCYENRVWHNYNNNSYSASTIHTYLNSTFLGLFDVSIQAQIKSVKIPFVNGTGSSAVASGANGLYSQIFLLGGYEVGWTTSNDSYFPVDGACLSYFSGTAETDSKRIAYLNSTATSWWLRSPYTYYTNLVWRVGTSGEYTGYLNPTNSFGVRPALVLPSDCKLTDNGEGKLILAGGAV